MNSVENFQGIPTNEIKVKAQAGLARYVQYAIKMFRNNQKTLILKGAGTATSKVLHLTEILKRRIGDLHQTNHIYSVEVDDKREGQGRGGKRRMSVFETVLSIEPLDKENIGYQDPIPREERPFNVNPQRFPRNNYRRGYYGNNRLRYGSYWPRYERPRDYDDFYDEGPNFNPRRGFRGRRFGNRYGSAYKPRRYQNQWVQDRRSRFDAMSQGPPQRFGRRSDSLGSFYSNDNGYQRRGFSARKRWRNDKWTPAAMNYRTPESHGKASSRMSNHQD
ncbi:unnamed protein product [Moneuplotes crassus]|uniref:DNA/RNA-binding protein Alba-like domain-containing protein n=1 Tax=Euplotes crassus TaxID=5936 RepID=A0AAD1XMS0_EUPCR|nr:unnamed protein product [Moneuplotes crassus]